MDCGRGLDVGGVAWQPVAEQRYRAVWEVLEGASVTEVARRFGVSRQSVHAWLVRYAADGGLGGLGVGRLGRITVRIR
jgi:transposase